tara:strand:- start:352 stop:888 length:537 start_codon:yes stop_codon:yes gene_type:complete
MFRRGFDHSKNKRVFNSPLEQSRGKHLLDPEDWHPHSHFLFVYSIFRDMKYMEAGNYSEAIETDHFVSETKVVNMATLGWFPKMIMDGNQDVLNDSMKETIRFIQETFYSENNTSKLMNQFYNSLTFLKEFLDNSKEKLELVLEDFWDIAVSNNNLEGTEREMFIESSKFFDIPVNIE